MINKNIRHKIVIFLLAILMSFSSINFSIYADDTTTDEQQEVLEDAKQEDTEIKYEDSDNLYQQVELYDYGIALIDDIDGNPWEDNSKTGEPIPSNTKYELLDQNNKVISETNKIVSGSETT